MIWELQYEERKGKPEPVQFLKDDGALWSVNICVKRGVTCRERSVNTERKRLIRPFLNAL